MRKLIVPVLCLFLAAAVPAGSGGQRTPRDILGSGQTGPVQWKEFLDAQVVPKGDDRLLQVLAVCRGELRAGPVRGARSGGVLGLWHAYQTGDGSWASNGVVFDLSAPDREGLMTGRGLTAASVAGDLRLAATSDPSGRLHVVLTDPGSGGRLVYLLRDNSSRWQAVTSEPFPEDLSEMCLVPHPEESGALLLGIAGGGRLTEYRLSPAARDRQGGVRSTRDAYPAELDSGAFAVSRDARKMYFLFQSPGGEFRGAERHIASGKWILEPHKFMRDFQGPTGGARLRSMCGFPDANGLPQVVALGGGGVVHIYRDEINTWYNNGVALQAGGLRRVSGCIDGRGLINVLGVTNDGRLWHGYRAEDHQWRDNGLLPF